MKNKRNFKKMTAIMSLALVLLSQKTVFAISDDFWNTFSSGIENTKSSISYSVSCEDEMEELKKEVRKDRSGIFGMNNMTKNLNEKGVEDFYIHNLVRFKVSTNTNDKEVNINNMIYKNSKDDIETINRIVREKARNLDGTNNIEKLYSAYGTVLEDFNYGFISNKGDKTTCQLLERNVLEGINGENVVCEAYSYYMAFFMNELGFNNRIVTGKTNSTSKNGHMWNIVEVEGKWYAIDATWGDKDNKKIKDKYFLSGQDDLVHHVVGDEYRDIYSKLEKKNYYYNEEESVNNTIDVFSKNKELLNTINNNRKLLSNKLDANGISNNKLVIDILKIYDEKINTLENSTKIIDADINSGDFSNKEANIIKDMRVQRADLTLLNNNIINFLVNNKDISIILKDENKNISENELKEILLKEYKKENDIEDSKKYFKTLNNEKIKLIDSNNIKSYIKGYSNGSFKPNNSVSRAETATMIGRLINGSSDFNEGINTFVDANNEWYSNAIGYISGKNLIKGYSDNTFKPNKNITRAEFATIISNYLGDIEVNNSALKDINNHWAKNSINKVYSKSIINGYPDKTFRPDIDITRAEAVTILNKVFNIENKNNKNVVFNDVFEKDWFFNAVISAAN